MPWDISEFMVIREVTSERDEKGRNLTKDHFQKEEKFVVGSHV